jgi:hypothetical protein
MHKERRKLKKVKLNKHKKIADDANKKAGEERKNVIALREQTKKLQKFANDAQQQAQKATNKAKLEQTKANDANK